MTPVSSNTALEASGWFERTLRTRIGSPFVIEGMESLAESGLEPVAGSEANGGFLLASCVVRDGRTLPALPTRDALIVALGILATAAGTGRKVSELVRDLPPRFTFSDRIKSFPTEFSLTRIQGLSTGDFVADRSALESIFGRHFGQVAGIDTTDGLRVTFESGEIAHLRPSGNAPELRAYTEADSPQRAREMGEICLRILESWRN